ncbi:MAG TPA: amidohydrolase family protein, partial [Limnochordales bacterium]
RPPMEFLSRFYFDTVLHWPKALRWLVETVGPDRVVLGSDYPFDMGDPDPVGSVERAGLGDEARRRVLHDNAAALFRLAG